MLSDTDIVHHLESIQPLGFAKVPHEGTWTRPPYERRAVNGHVFAVLCVDPRVQELLVNLDTGRIYTHPLDGPELFLVNSSLANLVACSRAYQDAASAVAEAEHADNPDRAREAIAQTLERQLRSLDPPATENHDTSLWLVAAEELGYGI